MTQQEFEERECLAVANEPGPHISIPLKPDFYDGEPCRFLVSREGAVLGIIHTTSYQVACEKAYSEYGDYIHVERLKQ